MAKKTKVKLSEATKEAVKTADEVRAKLKGSEEKPSAKSSKKED